jgi:hypothetical protein
MKGKYVAILTGALLLISSALFVYNGIIQKKYEEEKINKERYKSNAVAFQNVANGYFEENRVLRLNRDDLRQSNNEMINTIDSLKKSRKTPPNKPGDVSTGVTTVIHDTVEVLIPVPVEIKVDTTLVYNELTSVRIKIEKSLLSGELSVNNTQVLNVYTSREYVNVYDNWCKRLLRLDYKKHDVERYTIDNTNKLIKVTDAIVIKHE